MDLNYFLKEFQNNFKSLIDLLFVEEITSNTLNESNEVITTFEMYFGENISNLFNKYKSEIYEDLDNNRRVSFEEIKISLKKLLTAEFGLNEMFFGGKLLRNGNNFFVKNYDKIMENISFGKKLLISGFINSEIFTNEMNETIMVKQKFFTEKDLANFYNSFVRKYNSIRNDFYEEINFIGNTEKVLSLSDNEQIDFKNIKERLDTILLEYVEKLKNLKKDFLEIIKNKKVSSEDFLDFVKKILESDLVGPLINI